MKTRHVVALVLGCLIALPGLAMFLGGSALGVALIAQRDDDGYFDTTLDRLATDGVAITSGDLTFTADTDADWAMDVFDADLRLRVAAAASGDAVFVGIARTADVEAYLAGAAYDELIALDGRTGPEYRTRAGAGSVTAPTTQDFWTVSSWGIGTQEIDWETTNGRWTAVAMNADGSPDVAVDVNVAARSGVLLPLAILMLGAGVVVIVVSILLIVFAVRGHRAGRPGPDDAEPGTRERTGDVVGVPGSPSGPPDHLGTPLPPPDGSLVGRPDHHLPHDTQQESLR